MTGLRKLGLAVIGPLAAIGCKAPGVASPIFGRPNTPVPVAAAPLQTPAHPPSEAAVHNLELQVVAQGPFPVPQAGPTVRPVEFQETLPQITGDVLSREWLAAEVEARNPSLEAMIAAWQAAAQRFPQQVALDDPMLMGMIAPGSVGASTTETAYALQLNQKLPWRGKRQLRGEVADTAADAAFEDAEDARLAVRLVADLAFYEYFLATRLLDINRQNVQIMHQYRETAQSKYIAKLVSQQDVLQAEVELADLARRQLELDRMQRVAAARINTLLRRWPDAPLAAPPATLDAPQPVGEVNLLWQTALRQRPDLAALAWRVQSEEAALELAYKNYFPDFDLFGRYDTFWQPASTQGPLRAQVGVAMNLPVYREKLRAAICEAQFRLAQRRAEFEQRSLEIQYDVIAAAEQVEESRKTVELYAQQLIPIAAQNVEAVRANYTFAKATFIELAQARRQQAMLLERQLESIVTYHRRHAELDRAVGVTLRNAE